MKSPHHTPVVEVRNLERSFGTTLAVDGVSLHIRPGEIFGMLGPSGCGKTTLLRLIAGLDQPDAGSVLLNGCDVTDQPAYRRNIHTVFQSYALFPRMSVAANIEFGMRASRVPRADRRERVAEALKLVGLEGKERRRPHEISGGEQQRVALARALVNRPPVLLLDEPLAALDAHLRREMQSELRRIQHETGCSFILVTHDQDEAFSLCDRVAVMFNGQLRQIAAPDELYRNPASVEVARFVGRSSLLPAVWSQGQALLANEWGIAADAATELRERDACTLMLRPRQITFGGRQGLPGLIEHVAFAEDRYQSTVKTSIGIVSAETDEHPGPVGTAVTLGTNQTRGWVLPSEH